MTDPNRDRERTERMALAGKDRFLTGAVRKGEYLCGLTDDEIRTVEEATARPGG